jgi:hypothetical protein
MIAQQYGKKCYEMRFAWQENEKRVASDRWQEQSKGEKMKIF